MFRLVSVPVADMSLEALVFRDERFRLGTFVLGKIVNSVSTSSQEALSWKRLVASSVAAERGTNVLLTEWRYCITVGFRFHPNLHRNQKLDLDNYIKPVLDGVAAGLFCNGGAATVSIEKFRYDDSNFCTFVLHRVAEAGKPTGEGVGLLVSDSG